MPELPQENAPNIFESFLRRHKATVSLIAFIFAIFTWYFGVQNAAKENQKKAIASAVEEARLTVERENEDKVKSLQASGHRIQAIEILTRFSENESLQNLL